MTCAEADPWMLAARTADDLPERVRRHLAACSRCAARFDLLARVEVAAAQLAPSTDPSARVRLAERIARTPQQSPPRESALARTRTRERRIPRWVVGLAAATLLAFAWAAGRLTAPRPVAQAPNTPRQEETRSLARPNGPSMPVAPAPAPAPGLLAKTARHASHVAADPAPAAQVDALYHIAADVRADATKKAATGDVEQLPRLLALHKRVLKVGVARQLRRVPEQQRAAATAHIVAGLNQSAEEVSRAANQLPPAVGDALRPLATACEETSAALQQGRPASADGPVESTPLESLVAQTIRLAEAETALSRAYEAAQLAAVLSQVIAVLSVADLPDDATRVGEALNAVLDHGVAGNLERVEGADPAGKFRDDVAKIRDRAARATEVLERNLAKAPPAARPGLERALMASDAGRGKATGKGPGKSPGGPPWKKGDTEHPGKGWQKKP